MQGGLRRFFQRWAVQPPREAELRSFVDTAFRRVLRRPATELEQAHWEKVTRDRGPAEVLDLLFDGGEYRFRRRVEEAAEFFSGHFYSPVVDPEALRSAGFRVDTAVNEASLLGISLDGEEMGRFWLRHLQAMQTADFPEHRTAGRRYYGVNDLYSWGDACILLAMFREARPRRVLEVGSGFSSACMLDIADALGLETRFTFVEPYPERLYSLLGDGDHARCTVIETPVQGLDERLYRGLEPNDILFIDSTHVSKTGSDVNFELFEMLPRLKKGVIVHFHDVFYPFEYPEAWIFQARRSWNEVYALRAFLIYNQAFEIVFFNDYFARRRPDEAQALPRFLANPGGGLWLRKTGD